MGKSFVSQVITSIVWLKLLGALHLIFSVQVLLKCATAPFRWNETMLIFARLGERVTRRQYSDTTGDSVQCGYETKIVSQRWDWDKETSKKLSVSLDGGLWLYQAWVANGTLIKRWGLEPTHHDGVCLGTAWRKWRNWKKKMYRDFLRKDVIVFNGIGKKRSDVARRGKKNPLGFNYVNELWGAKKKNNHIWTKEVKVHFYYYTWLWMKYWDLFVSNEHNSHRSNWKCTVCFGSRTELPQQVSSAKCR